MPRHWRALVLLVLAAAWLAVPATDAVARKAPTDRSPSAQGKLDYPPPPRRAYTPRQVRQRLNNCAFSSAEMLIDKWTEGRVAAPQHALRRATDITAENGGPTLRQLRRAVAQVAGIDLRWSPHGGDSMTWQELLDRLGDGGGALVNVWPADLPAHYRRWIPSLTRGHSVYVERYQPSKKRLWLMDPLGRGPGFAGEWIDADILHKAIWRSGGYVWAAATPAREPAPVTPSLGDFQLGRPTVDAVGFSNGSVELAIGYAARHPDAVLPPLRVAAHWQPLPAEQPVDAVDPADEEVARIVRRDPPMPPFEWLSEPLAAGGNVLRTGLVTPAVAGDYELSLELRDGDGLPTDGYAAEYEPMIVRLLGPLAGGLGAQLPPARDLAQGESLSLVVDAANLGSADWGESGEPVALAIAWPGAEASLTVPLEVPAGETVELPLTLLIDGPVGPSTLRLDLRDAMGATLPEAVPIEFVIEIRHAEPDPIQ